MPVNNNKLGRYEIIREIARSNDIVYEAIDPSIGRRIALKELQMPSNLVGSAKRERIERFYREAKAAGHLAHPNIVTIYEVGEDAGRHFIAMEFLEGQTLQDSIEIRGAIPAKESVDIVLQVLDGLKYAHAHGVIHRDIKPANIQILPGGLVKLTDFGIARITAEPSITATGQIFGTPSYMSPEQIAGGDIDARSDLFSVGIVLYESLTAAKPFTGDSVVTITYNIMNSAAPRPAGVPSGLADCVEKALQKDLAARFQSADEFMDELKRRWDAQQPNPAAAPPPPIFFPPGQVLPPSPGGLSPTGVPGNTGPQARPSVHLQPPNGIYQPRKKVARPQTPVLSANQRAALTTMLLAGLLGFVILLAIFGVSKAFDSYQQQQHDQQAAPHVQRGDMLLKQNHYAEAIKQYEAALGMDVSSRNKTLIQHNINIVRIQWAQDLLDQNSPTDAVKVLNDALSSNSNSGDVLFLLGVAHARLGHFEESLKYWEQAVSRDPASQGGKFAVDRLQSYYYDQGQNFELQGNRSEAISMYRQVIDIDAGTPTAMMAQDRIDAMMLLSP